MGLMSVRDALKIHARYKIGTKEEEAKDKRRYIL